MINKVLGQEFTDTEARRHYKGAQQEEIEIEVMNGRDVSLELISPDAASIVEEVRDKLIDEQLDKIREFAPEIPIIEV